jgi:glutamyl-tRNA reductase
MTSSLESLVVGETQITGQFKQAAQLAEENELSGPALKSLADEALRVAKRVKRETSIGQGCVSMASLAASTLSAALKKHRQPRIALVGSGAMTVKLAKQIRKISSAELLFVNRTVSKIESLAKEHDSEAIALDEFLAAPPAVDAIVSATAASNPVFDRDFLARLEQNDREVVCIDLAVPGDFSGDYIDAPSIQFINISELKSRGQGNLRQKFIEVSKANEIVRECVNKYLSNRIEVSLKPIFHDSYRESMALAQQALDDLFSRHVTGLAREDREAVLRLVTKLISHSSFQPVKKLSDHLVQKRAELNLTDTSAPSKEAV